MRREGRQSGRAWCHRRGQTTGGRDGSEHGKGDTTHPLPLLDVRKAGYPSLKELELRSSNTARDQVTNATTIFRLSHCPLTFGVWCLTRSSLLGFGFPTRKFPLVMLRAGRIVRDSKRGFATVVDAPSGLKVAAVDNAQPSSSVTVLLKAGSRYQSKPGVAHALLLQLMRNQGSVVHPNTRLVSPTPSDTPSFFFTATSAVHLDRCHRVESP